jgi:hypothetical protein
MHSALQWLLVNCWWNPWLAAGRKTCYSSIAGAFVAASAAVPLVVEDSILIL